MSLKTRLVLLSLFQVADPPILRAGGVVVSALFALYLCFMLPIHASSAGVVSWSAICFCTDGANIAGPSPRVPRAGNAVVGDLKLYRWSEHCRMLLTHACQEWAI